MHGKKCSRDDREDKKFDGDRAVEPQDDGKGNNRGILLKKGGNSAAKNTIAFGKADGRRIM